MVCSPRSVEQSICKFIHAEAASRLASIQASGGCSRAVGSTQGLATDVPATINLGQIAAHKPDDKQCPGDPGYHGSECGYRVRR